MFASLPFLIQSINAQAPDFQIYDSIQCTDQVSAIDWGSRSPGDTVIKIVYVKNLVEEPITKLTVSTQGFSPSESQNSLYLSTPSQTIIINKDMVTPLILSLKISDSTHNINTFSFNIIVTAEYQEQTGNGGGIGGYHPPLTKQQETIGTKPAPDFSNPILLVIIVAVVYLLLGGRRKL